MAEFCLECHLELFGNEIECGLSGLISEEYVKDGYALPVLCESCGFIYVDHNGKKIDVSDENEDGNGKH
tara:strand:- start:3242 stop:3448 length:207 start_codon:yes stop_codon:yes gene_type:complete